MQFFYQNAIVPPGTLLPSEIQNAALRLYSKLNRISPVSLDISDYQKKYLGDQLAELQAWLQKYAFILAWSTAGMNIPVQKCTLLDYGGGTGLLSLLAKELNFGSVLYNDIYDVSCHDAETIGLSAGIRADHYITGDIDEVIACLRNNRIRCNAVVSYDVIEHIYDTGDFIRKLPEITDTRCASVIMASSANSCNPFRVRKLKKGQRTAEYETRVDQAARKQRDSLESYYSLRKRIIAAHAPGLQPREIDELSSRTRGLIARDILTVVSEYEKSGILPPGPVHPTNTCDPCTGNWAEHLMDIAQLKKQLHDSGYTSRIIPGYYGNSKKMSGIMNSMVIPGINSLINLPKYGIRIAPFFALRGIRCHDQPCQESAES